MANNLVGEAPHPNKSADLVKELLQSSRSSQFWSRAITLLVILLTVIGSQAVTYSEVQTTHNTAHQTILNLEAIVNNLQSKSSEQTMVETQLRTIVENQASAINALSRDDAINTQFRSLISDIYVVSLTGSKAQIDALIAELKRFIVPPTKGHSP